MPSSGTSNFNRRGIMKKSILIVLASILLSYPMNLLGGDFETPHEFMSGDTISAEMMNEIFEYIKNANKMISASELIGTWSCELYTTTGECMTANSQLAADKKWDNGTGDQLNIYNTNNITFIEDKDGAGEPDGTYSYTTPLPNMFNCADAQHGGFGKWIVKNNALFMTFSSGGNAGNPGVEAQTMVVKLKKVTNTKILMEFKPTKPVFTECEKQNLPPKPPSSLTHALPADNTSSSITLTWTDNQTEAVTGYKVNRKTAATDNFTTVSTITDNTTRTYADDNVTESGKYWYRVLAYNTYGDGTPSKVVKASFPDDEAPTGTLKIDNATTTTTSSSVTLNLTATDNKGVVGYLASESSAPPSTDSTSWVSITSTTSYSADVSFTLSSGYGVKFVYVWFRDGKGNIAGYGASIEYRSQ